MTERQENTGGKMLDALLVLYIANELLCLVARAIENGKIFNGQIFRDHFGVLWAGPQLGAANGVWAIAILDFAWWASASRRAP